MKKYINLPNLYHHNENDYISNYFKGGIQTYPLGSHISSKQSVSFPDIYGDGVDTTIYDCKFFKAFSETISPDLNLGMYITDAQFFWDFWFDKTDKIIGRKETGKYIKFDDTKYLNIYNNNNLWTLNYYNVSCDDTHGDSWVDFGFYSGFNHRESDGYTLDIPDININTIFAELYKDKTNGVITKLYYPTANEEDRKVAVMVYKDEDNNKGYIDFFDTTEDDVNNLRMRVTTTLEADESARTQELYLYFKKVYDGGRTTPKVCVYVIRKGNDWSQSLRRYDTTAFTEEQDYTGAEHLGDVYNSDLFKTVYKDNVLHRHINFLQGDDVSVIKKHEVINPSQPNLMGDCFYMKGSVVSVITDEDFQKSLNKLVF